MTKHELSEFRFCCRAEVVGTETTPALASQHSLELSFRFSVAAKVSAAQVLVGEVVRFVHKEFILKI